MQGVCKYLKDNNIVFALIVGKYNQVDDAIVKPDIDIVLKNKSSILAFKNPAFKFIHQYRFREILTGLNIDLYCQFLNVGYYYYLRISQSSYDNYQISDLEYLIYLILDPLLKFSEYHTRHKKRLSRYSHKDLDQAFVLIASMIGLRLSKVLYQKIASRDFNVSSFFIKQCKFKLLFINGNFVRMCKYRFLTL